MLNFPEVGWQRLRTVRTHWSSYWNVRYASCWFRRLTWGATLPTTSLKPNTSVTPAENPFQKTSPFKIIWGYIRVGCAQGGFMSTDAMYFQERNHLCVPTVRKPSGRGKVWRTTKTSSTPRLDWNTVPPVGRSSPPTEVWRVTWTWSTGWRSGFNVNTAGSIFYQPRATGLMKNWLRARPTLVISVAGCTSRHWDTITISTNSLSAPFFLGIHHLFRCSPCDGVSAFRKKT